MYETTLSNGQRQYTVYSKDGRVLLVTSQLTLALYIQKNVSRCRPGQVMVVGGGV
jgi:hypothetical protein